MSQPSKSSAPLTIVPHETQAADAQVQAPAARNAAPMKLIVGIATSGRPTILIETIAELRRQSRPADMIMICSHKAEDVAGIEPAPDLMLVKAAQGCVTQRNKMLDLADGYDLMVFFDDDFLPDHEWLATCEKTFVSNPEIVGLTGKVLADGAKGPGLTVADGRRMLADPVLNAEPDLSVVVTAWNTYGCNMAFRLSTVRKQGLRFDTRLPLYGWYEDIDFSRRIGLYGLVVHANMARGVHLGTKKGRTSGKRLGYSQVVNPFYLARKGTYPWSNAFRSASRNAGMNLTKSFRPEPYIDRRGRLVGNVLGLVDLIRGKVYPERILRM